MQKYVLGFLYTSDFKGVWLILKTKPDWQKGLLNGIGGKIEDGETPMESMRREFREETGLDIIDWREFCIITDNKNFEMYCFCAFSELTPTTITEEEVVYSDIFPLPKNIIVNLNWLVPMGLHSRGFHVKVIYD